MECIIRILKRIKSLFPCLCKNNITEPHQKSNKEYYQEIFDGLDTNGTQTLTSEQLGKIWKLVQQKRVTELENDLANYINKINDEIKNTNSQTAGVLTTKHPNLNLRDFTKIMKDLDLEHNKLHKLWINTKRDEMISIKKEMETYNVIQ